MADYSSSLSLANRLIAKKGMEIVYLRREISGEIDIKTGKRPVRITESRVMAVLSRPTREEIAEGHFQGVGQTVLVPGDAVKNPAISDRLRFSGREWEITEILEIAPGGTPVLYKLGVREAGNVSGLGQH